jgi:hypothetical protein
MYKIILGFVALLAMQPALAIRVNGNGPPTVNQNTLISRGGMVDAVDTLKSQLLVDGKYYYYFPGTTIVHPSKTGVSKLQLGTIIQFTTSAHGGTETITEIWIIAEHPS